MRECEREEESDRISAGGKAKRRGEERWLRKRYKGEIEGGEGKWGGRGRGGGVK